MINDNNNQNNLLEFNKDFKRVFKNLENYAYFLKVRNINAESSKAEIVKALENSGGNLGERLLDSFETELRLFLKYIAK
jgi:hypothetical protein